MKKKIMLSAGGESRIIEVESIIYFASDNGRVRVVYVKGQDASGLLREESFSFPGTIAALESLLKDDGFCRIHKGFLVNINYLELVCDSYVVVSGARRVKIPIGKTYETGFGEVLSSCVISPGN